MTVDISIPSNRLTGAPRGCSSCFLRKPCGGHNLEVIAQIGCANLHNGLRFSERNNMNPLDDKRFWELWDDVGGLVDFAISKLQPVDSSELPAYIPLLQHHCSREDTLNIDVVALPLHRMFRRDRNGFCHSRFSDGADLRNYYRLGANTKVILSGVGADKHLERFWAEHRRSKLPEQLAVLDLLGVTTPNFSFFTDVTRFQILRNRKRLMLVNERLSLAGVPVIPHFNAVTDRDWAFWEEVLQEHSDVSVVALEFQTGYKGDVEGAKVVQRLVDIQQRVGRSIHPILHGGARYYHLAQQHFSRFSVLDSRPFMAAQGRRMLVQREGGGYRWCKVEPALCRTIDYALRKNLLFYHDKIQAPPRQKGQSVWIKDLRGQTLLGF